MANKPVAAFASLSPTFVEHAAPEAISRRIRDLQTQRRQINTVIGDLILLNGLRAQQIEEGTWPKR